MRKELEGGEKKSYSVVNERKKKKISTPLVLFCNAVSLQLIIAKTLRTVICHCFGSSFSFLKHLCILRKHSPPKLLEHIVRLGFFQVRLLCTQLHGLAMFSRKENRCRSRGAESTSDRTSGPAGRRLPARRPARPAPHARGFEPALRTRERRESGNASVPAGGCPAFVSSFPSGGEDMVRSRFQTDLGGGGLWRPGGKRARVSAGSEKRARSAPESRTG